MFIGKWNKSVILTYVGLAFSALGIALCFKNVSTLYPLACLMLAGICDMFDGKIARMCKRTEEEKQFGVELDSLVDVFNFIVFPIVIFSSLGLTNWYYIPIYMVFGICGVARLANFNIEVEDSSSPVKYYKGLPVTSSAIVFPVIYLLKYIIDIDIFLPIYALSMLIVAFLYVYNFKCFKPKGIFYYLFSVAALIMLIIYLIIIL